MRHQFGGAEPCEFGQQPLAGGHVGPRQRGDVVLVVAADHGIGDERRAAFDQAEAHRARAHPGAVDELEVFRHAAVEAHALGRVGHVDEPHGVAELEEALFVEGRGGEVGPRDVAREVVRAAHADLVAVAAPAAPA